MRIRTVKPEWLDDEPMVEAGSDARVLSIALILLADDSGRGRIGLSTPAKVFPCDPSVFHEALMRLSPWFVRVYEVRGQKYFQILNWRKHQKIQHPSAPRTPDPSEGQYVDGHGNPEPAASPPVTSSGDPHEGLTPDRDQDQYPDPDHARDGGEQKFPHEAMFQRPDGSIGIRKPHGFAQFMRVFEDVFAKQVTTANLGVFGERDKQSGQAILAFCQKHHASDPDGFYLAELVTFCERVRSGEEVVNRNAWAAFATGFGRWSTRTEAA